MTDTASAYAAIEETAEMYSSRRGGMLRLGLFLLAFYLLVFLFFVYGGSVAQTLIAPHGLPPSPVMGIFLLMVAVILSLGWYTVLDVLLEGLRVNRVSISADGIQMPIIPFREWLSGETSNFVRWADVRLISLNERESNRWGAVLADGVGHKYRVSSRHFGSRADVALRAIRKGIKHPSPDSS